MKWKSIDEVGSTVRHERGEERGIASDQALAKVRKASEARCTVRALPVTMATL